MGVQKNKHSRENTETDIWWYVRVLTYHQIMLFDLPGITQIRQRKQIRTDTKSIILKKMCWRILAVKRFRWCTYIVLSGCAECYRLEQTFRDWELEDKTGDHTRLDGGPKPRQLGTSLSCRLTWITGNEGEIYAVQRIEAPHDHPLRHGDVYRMAQKVAPFLYTLTSSNFNRFSKFFHCQNQEKICNNTITKDPTIHQVCLYTTLCPIKAPRSVSLIAPMVSSVAGLSRPAATQTHWTFDVKTTGCHFRQ